MAAQSFGTAPAWVGVAVLLVVASGALPGVGALVVGASGHPGLPFLSGLRQTTVTSSSNWAGFAAVSSKGSVTDVKGSWIVPKVTGCSGGNGWSSQWVGIDGVTSTTVEQTGTEADCSGGVAAYSAWYEFYPAYPVTLSLAVHPGDTIFAEVHYAAGVFTTTLRDVTTAKSASHSKTTSTPARSSAEWIVEAPSSSTGVLPLADFGTVKLGIDYTNVTSTNWATISNTTGTLGHFSSLLYRISMTGSTGTKASVSRLTSDLKSFTVTWVSAGP